MAALRPAYDNRLTTQLEINPGDVPTHRCSRRRVGGRGGATAGADPVGRHSDCFDDGCELGDTYAAFQVVTSEEAANWKFFSQFISEPLPADAIDLIVSFMSKAPTPECNYFTNASRSRARQ